MHVRARTYVHTCLHIHMHIYIYIHTYIHTCIHTYLHDSQVPIEKVVEKSQGTEKIVTVEVEKIIEVPVDRIIEVSKDKMVEVPVEKIIEVPVEKIIEVPVDRIIEVPVDKIIEVPVEKLIEVPVEKIIEVAKDRTHEEGYISTPERKKLQADLAEEHKENAKLRESNGQLERDLAGERVRGDGLAKNLGDVRDESVWLKSELERARKQVTDLERRIELERKIAKPEIVNKIAQVERSLVDAVERIVQVSDSPRTSPNKYGVTDLNPTSSSKLASASSLRSFTPVGAYTDPNMDLYRSAASPRRAASPSVKAANFLRPPDVVGLDDSINEDLLLEFGKVVESEHAVGIPRLEPQTADKMVGRMCVHLCVFFYLCVYIWMVRSSALFVHAVVVAECCGFLGACVRVYVFVLVCTSTYIHTYIHAYIHTYIHTSTRNETCETSKMKTTPSERCSKT
jgi:hypothetical protein